MADDCFGPESGGSATRPLTSGSTGNADWITAETTCGAGDGSRILELLNSMVANLRNVCNFANGDPLIKADPCDTVVIDAIIRAPCAAELASADQLTTICDDLDNHYIVTWLTDGTPVRVPLSKLGGGGGTDPGGGGDTCDADADGVVRAVGDTVVQWEGDWSAQGSLSSTSHGTPPGAPPPTGGVISMQPPDNQEPNARGFAGTWTSGSEVIVQNNDENADLTCRLWTKQSC